MVAIALAAGSATAAWSWQANRYDAELSRQALSHSADLSSIANAASTKSRVLLEKNWALQGRLQLADKTHHSELNRVQTQHKRLLDRLATADLRLSVLLAQPAAGGRSDMPTDAETGGLVHGSPRAELDRAHAQRIVAIADDGDQALIALGACQAYVSEITAAP